MSSPLASTFSATAVVTMPSGTSARVAFSADALSQARLLYTASANGAYFAISSFRAFNRNTTDSDVVRADLTLQPHQHMYALAVPAACLQRVTLCAWARA